MRIIKLSAIDSTNSFLRQLYVEEAVKDYTVIVAEKQTKGRGQMGTIWNAEASKNLTFSVFKGLVGLEIQHAFFVSIATSLALVKTLEHFGIPKLKIKWPNDILSEKLKISGILIENILKNNQLDASIIGVGLNVNQTQFKQLPKASSLCLLTGKIYNLDEILQTFVKNLQSQFDRLRFNDIDTLKLDYESYLFRNNKPSTFMDSQGNLFMGYIKGISHSGKLKLFLEDEVLKEFDLKEVTLMY